MSTPSLRRILADYKQIKLDYEKGLYAEPLENDLHTWKAVIIGPYDTIWDGGCFKLTLKFTSDYPTNPPSVKFNTPVFHPNGKLNIYINLNIIIEVYSDGKICLDILDKSWTPMYNLSGILFSIQSLLNDPNPDSPANNVASKLYVDNLDEYNNQVKKCVEDSWNFLKTI